MFLQRPNAFFESSKSDHNLLTDRLNSKLNSNFEEKCNDSSSCYSFGKEREFDSEALDLKISSCSSSSNKRCKKEDEENSKVSLKEENKSKCDYNGKSFPCPNCHKTFATQADLKAHLMRHITQHPYVCFACGKGFKYDHTLDFHIKSQHGVDGNSSINMKTLGRKNLKPKRESLDDIYKKKSVNAEADVDSLSEDTPCEDANNNHLSSSLNSDQINTSSSSEINLQGNLTPRSIQIKSEKVLITLLEGLHPITEQSYSLYKCCLCGFAFPNLEPVGMHIQLMHSNHSSFICDKCGATFKWRSELELHEQLHKAMDQSSKCKQLLVPSFLQPNLVFINPYFGEDVPGSSFNISHDPEHNSNNNSNNISNNSISNCNSNADYGDNQGLNLCMNTRNEENVDNKRFEKKKIEILSEMKNSNELQKEP